MVVNENIAAATVVAMVVNANIAAATTEAIF